MVYIIDERYTCVAPEEHAVSWALNHVDNTKYYLQVHRASSSSVTNPTNYQLVKDLLPASTTVYSHTISCVAYPPRDSAPINQYIRYKVQLRRRSDNALVTEAETPVRGARRYPCECT